MTPFMQTARGEGALWPGQAVFPEVVALGTGVGHGGFRGVCG